MGMQKGYMTNINIVNGKIGPDRRQEILDGISNKGTFLPKGVLEEDMDQTFVEFLGSDNGLSISIDGKKVPVIFLTIQRWTEFSKTWQFSDKYKDIELPFITVVRKPDIQQGQNQAGLWNIPGNQTYVYYKVPTWDGIRKGIDLYKIPQPTPVDITYEVRLFSNRMKELNKFNRKIQRAFQSRQCYITPNGHPMPLHLENIGDESNIEDFENRRFYVQMYEIKLLGYLLDEDDFEVVPTFNRQMLMIESENDSEISNNLVIFDKEIINTSLTYLFNFKAKSNNNFKFIATNNSIISNLIVLSNINRIIITINGNSVFDGTILTTPLNISENDIITIRISKGRSSDGIFKLIGEIN